MKFDNSVLQVMNQLMESYFWFDVKISSWWSWDHSCREVLPPGE